MKTDYIFPEITPDGIKTGNRVTGWSGAVRHFDSPRFDHCLPEGFRWLACIYDAKKFGWANLSTEQEVSLHRWLVSSVFINEERVKNGTVEVLNDDGGTDIAVIYRGKDYGLSIYPGPLRLSLANHVEEAFIEKYGTEQGMVAALRMYRGMLTADLKLGFKISDMGREGLEILLNDWIEMVNNNVMPARPVMH